MLDPLAALVSFRAVSRRFIPLPVLVYASFRAPLPECILPAPRDNRACTLLAPPAGATGLAVRMLPRPVAPRFILRFSL